MATHARPSRLGSTTVKVSTAVAVTGVVVVAGGVAAANIPQLRPGGSSQEADGLASQYAGGQVAQDIVAKNIAARDTAVGLTNRDLARSPLADNPPTVANSLADILSRTSGPRNTPGPLSGGSASTVGGTPSTTAATTDPTTAPSTTPSQTPTTTPTPTTPPPTTTPKPTPTPTGSSSGLNGVNASPAQARAIAQQLVAAGQFGCFDNIITRESSWNLHATNPSSGAYGLPQSLPGIKMASAGPNWENDAVTQIKWAISYMTSRYGSPCAAWAFWQAHHWY